MKSSSVRRAIVPGIAALALALSACSASNESDDTNNAGSSDVNTDVSGTLAGGGASSQQAAQAVWKVGFEGITDATIEYDPVGSGGGREQFIAGAFPFAGSDAYLEDEELAAATETCGGDPIEVPNYVSPIAIAYNVEGVDNLQLSPATIAGIFSGEITSWDDQAIADENPNASLPAEAIQAIHRSDESGTTENFTDYLTAVAPDVWTAGPVETWPTEYGGEGARGTSGVVDTVGSSAFSIGYADASQTGDLNQVLVGVGDDFVEPSADAAARILEVSPRVDEASTVNLAVDLDHETQEAGVYPIVLTSYLLLCPTYADQETADLVTAFASYVLGPEGQQAAADEAGSAPLSDTLTEQAMAAVETISAG